MLLVNRQPTLHKPGIMAHKARYYTFLLFTHAYCGKFAHIFLTTLLSTADIINIHYFRWCFCILYNTVICVFYAFVYTIHSAHFIYITYSYKYWYTIHVPLTHTESSGTWPRRPCAWAMPTATRTTPTSMEMRWTATSYRYCINTLCVSMCMCMFADICLAHICEWI